MKKNKNVKEIFIKRFKELLKEKNVNCSQLCKVLAIPESTLSNWKNGNRTIQIDNLVLIADFFEVSTDYLLGRED